MKICNLSIKAQDERFLRLLNPKPSAISIHKTALRTVRNCWFPMTQISPECSSQRKKEAASNHSRFLSSWLHTIKDETFSKPVGHASSPPHPSLLYSLNMIWAKCFPTKVQGLLGLQAVTNVTWFWVKELIPRILRVNTRTRFHTHTSFLFLCSIISLSCEEISNTRKRARFPNALTDQPSFGTHCLKWSDMLLIP